MTWVKLDDRFFTNPKAIMAGKDGKLLYLAGLCFANANLTDGTIPKDALPMVAAMAGTKPAAARQLVAAGLWDDSGDHFQVHAYLEYQPAASQIRADREASASRQKKWRESRRDKGGRDAVTESVSNGVSSPSPPHPTPITKSSTDRSKSARGKPDDDDPVIELLAERRADLEHPDGQGIGHRPAYLAKVRASYTTATPRLAELREQHPTWTTEQLADELDPDTAPRLGNAMTVEETDAHLAEIEAARASATPMPPGMRNTLR